MPLKLFAKIRRKVRNWLAHRRDNCLVNKHGKTLFTSEEIHLVVSQNRAALSLIPNWIDEQVYERSIFNYGLPRRVKSLINEPTSREPTYTDAICYLQSKITTPIRYLELGVSVGKNFFQIASFLQNASLTGFDIEEINPILESKFAEKAMIARWPTVASSMKKADSSMTGYKFHSNQVNYLSGDIFDENTWARLDGMKFNVIFSDAFHSPEALRFEYAMIRRYDLIDRNNFIILWDDLGGDMTPAFLDILARIESDYGLTSENLAINRYRGWMGQHEQKHLIGIIYKLPA